MMMDGLDHPKTLDLAARLDASIPAVIGHLELLWAFVAQKTPHGNIGKWPDGTIARAAQWTGDPSVFVTALHRAGFIDASKQHRFVIHDWHEHAPRWVKSKLSRAEERFASVECSADYSAESMPSHATSSQDSFGASPQSDDTTEPKKPKAKTGRHEYPDEFEQAWVEYPGRDGANPKREAFRAWNARRKQGVTPSAMLVGTKRYAAHIRAHGKQDTPYVMQASRFYGPSDLYAEKYSTEPPADGQKPQPASRVMEGFD